MTSIAPWALKDPVTNDQAERIISAVARRSLSPAAEAWLRGEDPAFRAPHSALALRTGTVHQSNSPPRNPHSAPAPQITK